MAMGDYFDGFIQEEARNLGMTNRRNPRLATAGDVRTAQRAEEEDIEAGL